jgi:hypothetical protein
MTALIDFGPYLCRLAVLPSLRCLMIGEGQAGEAEFVAHAVCQKEGDRLFVVHRWPDVATEQRFRERLARFGEKVAVRATEAPVSWIAKPVPYQRELAGGLHFIYVDARAMNAMEIACRSDQAWDRLRPDGVMVWRDYLHPRRGDIKKAVDQVLKDRPHRVVFKNGYLGVASG